MNESKWECPGCGGPVVCAAWCRVGKHERVRRATAAPVRSARRVTVPTDYAGSRYGPMRKVVLPGDDGGDDTLSCGHKVSASRVHRANGSRRCGRCLALARSGEELAPRKPAREVDYSVIDPLLAGGMRLAAIAKAHGLETSTLEKRKRELLAAGAA